MENIKMTDEELQESIIEFALTYYDGVITIPTIQRRFNIGRARAIRIINQLKDNGYIETSGNSEEYIPKGRFKVLKNLREVVRLKEVQKIDANNIKLQNRINELERENKVLKHQKKIREDNLMHKTIDKTEKFFVKAINELENKLNDIQRGQEDTAKAAESRHKETMAGLKKVSEDVKEAEGNITSKLNEMTFVIESIKDNMKKLNDNVIDLKGVIEKKVLVGFFEAKNDLINKLAEVSNYEDREMQIAAFIAERSKEFENGVMINNDVVKEEKEYLSGIFGDNWAGLREGTRSSLISARVLWRACFDISDDGFDYSGVCISLAAALEAEVKRVLFFGLQRFITLEQKLEGKKLQLPKELDYNGGYNDGHSITLGSVAYLLGKEKKIKKGCSQELIEWMKKYLQTIKKDNVGDLFYQLQENLAKKCNLIVSEYRNPAAHTGVITREKIENCYCNVLYNELYPTRNSAKKIIKDATRLLWSLYCESVDINKLKKLEEETKEYYEITTNENSFPIVDKFKK